MERSNSLSEGCVEETYIAWYKIWLETLVPKLMFTSKWFKTDKKLKQGDLVYFRKIESAFDGKWVIGIVEDIERGRDNIIRMVSIKYFNGMKKTPQITLRTVRKLVKLWDIDDLHLEEDLAELQKKFGPIPRLSGGNKADTDDTPDKTVDKGGANAGHHNDLLLQVTVTVADVDTQLGPGGDQQDKLADLRVFNLPRVPCRVCCCGAHHLYSLHYGGSKFVALPCDSTMWEFPTLVKEFNKNTSSVDMIENGVGLEDIINNHVCEYELGLCDCGMIEL